MKFWITLEVELDSDNLDDAYGLAHELAGQILLGGRTIDVQHAPPQGSTIVGDYDY